MQIKTGELIDGPLDWAVAVINYKLVHGVGYITCIPPGKGWVSRDEHRYSTDWAQGGPIIEREGIELICNLNPAEAARFKTEPHWRASKRAWSKGDIWYGPTPLIAAMRCYVASRLGDEVEVPDELLA